MDGTTIHRGGTVLSQASAELLSHLEKARALEKEQTLYYRALAARAEVEEDPVASERLNELHADEQHHLSRLTARLLELGGTPIDLPGGLQDLSLEGWEEEATRREDREVEFYGGFLEAEYVDEETREVLAEILESERQHRRHLGGKWMSA
jgi:rubrerythrin